MWRARWLDEGEHEARLVSVAEVSCLWASTLLNTSRSIT